MAPTTSAGRLPADASPGPSPSPPTAWAPRSQGGPARRRWPRGGLIRGGPASRAAVSGATLAAASESVSQQRRGGRNRTARGAEPATGVRCADGEGLHPAQRVAVTPASSSQRHRVAAQGIASQAYDISPHATGTRPARSRISTDQVIPTRGGESEGGTPVTKLPRFTAVWWRGSNGVPLVGARERTDQGSTDRFAPLSLDTRGG